MAVPYTIDTGPGISFEAPKLSPQEHADALIAIGDFAAAKIQLETAAHQASHPEAAIKNLIMLPFHELAWRNNNRTASDPLLLQQAGDIHGHLGSLLEIQLQKIESGAVIKGTSSYRDLVGNISELTILTLGARHYNQTGESFMIPASHREDNAGHGRSTDIHLIFADRARGRERIQVKTSRRAGVEARYREAIRIVAIEDLDDRRYNSPAHPRSIYQLIVKELDGSATDREIGVLNMFTDKLMRRVTNR